MQLLSICLVACPWCKSDVPHHEDSIGLGSDGSRGHLNIVNVLSCLINQVDLSWNEWHDALSCWKQPSESFKVNEVSSLFWCLIWDSVGCVNNVDIPKCIMLYKKSDGILHVWIVDVLHRVMHHMILEVHVICLQFFMCQCRNKSSILYLEPLEVQRIYL